MVLDKTPLGIAFPVRFSTNKLTRQIKKTDPNTGHISIRGGIPQEGYMELYFSHQAVNIERIDLLEPGKIFTKSEKLYESHHIYGDHKFLVPVLHENIERYDAPHNMRFSFGRIGKDPTTATYQEILQLMPCSQFNLNIIKDRLQSEQFYIEICDNSSFLLHICRQGLTYRQVPSQKYCPRCWHGFAHPVITIDSKCGSQPIYKLSDIPWDALAEQI